MPKKYIKVSFIKKKNSQIIIKQLRDKLENMKSDVEIKNSDITCNKEQLDVIRAQFANLLSTCEEVYNDYDVKRIQVNLFI